MDSEINERKPLVDEGLNDESTARQSGSRRQFTRNAGLAGVVLLSLGNRSAWGAMNGGDKVCFSKALMESFAMNGLNSMAPGSERESEIQRFLTYEQAHPNALRSEERIGGELKYCFTEPETK